MGQRSQEMKGGRGGGGGGGGLHLKLPHHCQNDSALRWVRGVRHFDVALIVKGKVLGPRPFTTHFEEKES